MKAEEAESVKQAWREHFKTKFYLSSAEERMTAEIHLRDFKASLKTEIEKRIKESEENWGKDNWQPIDATDILGLIDTALPLK